MSPRFPRLSSAPYAVLAVAGWFVAGCSPAAKPVATPAKPAAAHAESDDHHDDHEGHDHSAHGDHDHAEKDHAAEHDHPETLAAAVAELEALTKDVAEKLAGDAHEAADHAVHAAGHLLDDARDLLAKETLTADAKEAATKALDEIFECFDKLDVALHSKAKEGAESVAEIHASIADRVSEAVKALKERFPTEEK